MPKLAAVDVRSINCTFDDDRICGYEDITHSPMRMEWFRRKEKEFDETSPGNHCSCCFILNVMWLSGDLPRPSKVYRVCKIVAVMSTIFSSSLNSATADSIKEEILILFLIFFLYHAWSSKSLLHWTSVSQMTLHYEKRNCFCIKRIYSSHVWFHFFYLYKLQL